MKDYLYIDQKCGASLILSNQRFWMRKDRLSILVHEPLDVNAC